MLHPSQPAVLCSYPAVRIDLGDQWLSAIRFLAPVVCASAAVEEEFLAAAPSELLSISMEPLKKAPSAIITRAVVMSPWSDPSFLISTRSVTRTFPVTLP